jgi:hypothetical protein
VISSSCFTVCITPSGLFPSELIWCYGSYSQLVGLLGRVLSLVIRTLPTQDNTNTEGTKTDIMPRVGFEPMIPVFERTKTFHALDRGATVIAISDLINGSIVRLYKRIALRFTLCGPSIRFKESSRNYRHYIRNQRYKRTSFSSLNFIISYKIWSTLMS